MRTDVMRERIERQYEADERPIFYLSEPERYLGCKYLFSFIAEDPDEGLMRAYSVYYETAEQCPFEVEIGLEGLLKPKYRRDLSIDKLE